MEVQDSSYAFIQAKRHEEACKIRDKYYESIKGVTFILVYSKDLNCDLEIRKDRWETLDKYKDRSKYIVKGEKTY